MGCDRSEIQYYLDNELRSPELEVLEAHLAACADCRSYYEQECRLQKAISDAKPLYTASPQLRAAVESITKVATVHPTPADLRRRVERSLSLRRGRKWLAVAALLLIAVSVLWQMSRAPSVPEFIRMAVDTHQRRLRGQLPLEVATSSPSEVSRWFDGKVSFRLELPAYAGEGYRLEGARLVGLGRDYCAYIGYMAGSRPVTMLVASSSTASATGGEEITLGRLRFHCTTVDSFKVISWVDHGITYALVSDLEGRGERSCVVCHADPRLYQSLAPLNP